MAYELSCSRQRYILRGESADNSETDQCTENEHMEANSNG